MLPVQIWPTSLERRQSSDICQSVHFFCYLRDLFLSHELQISYDFRNAASKPYLQIIRLTQSITVYACVHRVSIYRIIELEYLCT